MFWHEKPAWQLCVPVTHSSTSATQRLGIRGRKQESLPSQPEVGGRRPHPHSQQPCHTSQLHTIVTSAAMKVCIPVRWQSEDTGEDQVPGVKVT